jgi:glycosyltransferase involved in cell wall biosynthesis
VSRVLIVSGIWPPDVGGPASHGPGVARFLAARGHDVRAVISSDGDAVDIGVGMLQIDRRRPLFPRLSEGARALVGAARWADVVYATGIYSRAALACWATGTPLVLKLVNDPAFERARNRGFYSGTIEAFQADGTHPGARALVGLRRWTLAVPRTIITPSHYLGRIVRGWGIPEARLDVIPNPVPAPAEDDDRDDLRRRFGLTGPTAVFAGRFVPQKDLGFLLTAFARVPQGDLVLVGDGPEKPEVLDAIARHDLGDRVRLAPAASREDAMRWMRAADVSVLASAWENFPHAVVESLTVGTPVVATAVGGVPEIIQPGENGFLVDHGDADGLATALTGVLSDPAERERLAAGALESATAYTEETAFSRLEALLVAATGSRRAA